MLPEIAAWFNGFNGHLRAIHGYQDFEFSVPVSGAITFKITFEEGILPKVWPEARTRKTRKITLEEAPVPEHITAGLQAALEQAEAEGQPMAEIAEAAAQGAEITTELNGQELTITAHETENMEAAFNVTGERRKALVEAVKAFIDAPAVYQNAPSFAYVQRLHSQQNWHSIRPGERNSLAAL